MFSFNINRGWILYHQMWLNWTSNNYPIRPGWIYVQIEYSVRHASLYPHPCWRLAAGGLGPATLLQCWPAKPVCFRTSVWETNTDLCRKLIASLTRGLFWQKSVDIFWKSTIFLNWFICHKICPSFIKISAFLAHFYSKKCGHFKKQLY